MRTVLAVCVALAGCVLGTGTVCAEEVATLDAAQVRALVDANRGHPVVVNFWATWCPPCLREFPAIIETYEQHRAQGLVVIAVSMNADDETEDVAEFLTKFAPPFPVYRAASIDAEFYAGVVEPWYGELPITLVYAPSGELARYHRQAVTYAELAAELAALGTRGAAD